VAANTGTGGKVLTNIPLGKFIEDVRTAKFSAPRMGAEYSFSFE